MPYTKFGRYKLKDLPEKTKQYKYHLIIKHLTGSATDYYTLYCSDQPFMHKYGMVSVFPELYNSNADVNYTTWSYNSKGRVWESSGEVSTLKKGSEIGVGDGDGFIWANYDVMKGSEVYLAASEAIPMPYVRIVDPLNLYTIVKYPYGFGSTTCMVFVERHPSGNRYEWTATLDGKKNYKSRIIRDSETGVLLTILLNQDETATSVELVVDCEYDGTTFRTRQTFTVVPYSVSGDVDSGGGDGGDIEESLITNIELVIHPNELSPGGHALASVIVDGTGEVDPDFTVEISESTSLNTRFIKGSGFHNIWVGEDETAEYILVTVASVQDPTMTATEMIYINHSVTDDGSGDAEQLQLAYWKGYAAAKAMYGGGK